MLEAPHYRFLAALLFAPACLLSAPTVSSIEQLLSLPRDVHFYPPHSSPVRVSLDTQVTIGRPQGFGYIFQSGPFAAYAYAESKTPPPVRPGDLVHIEGTAIRGGYSPSILISSIRVTGHQPLPPAHPINFQQAKSDDFENTLVRMRIRLRQFRPTSIRGPNHVTPLLLEMADTPPGQPILTFPGQLISDQHPELSPYVDGLLEAVGVCGSAGNGRGQRYNIQLFLDGIDSIRMIHPPNPDWTLPVSPSGKILTYRSGHRVGDPIHVAATITRITSDGIIWVQDSSGGLPIEPSQPHQFSTGDSIEALGRIAIGNSGDGMFLAAALLRPGRPAPPLVPRRVSIEESISLNFQGQLVRLPATVTAIQHWNTHTQIDVRFEHHQYLAEVPRKPNDGWREPQPGDKIEIIGVPQLVSSIDDTSTSGHIYTRGPDDIILIQTQPWHARFPWGRAAAVLVGIVLLGAGWIYTLHSRVRIQTRQLRRAQQTAERASAAKSRFLANMSHEIRTPLNGVLGINRLMLDSPLTPQQNEWATLIDSSGNSLLALLNDILDISKVEAGELRIEAIPFHPKSLIEQVINLAAALATTKCLRLHTAIESTLPVSLLGDPHRLRQIFSNFVSNAIKFTPKGHVEIALTWTEHTPPSSGTLRICVTDSGIGLSPEQQSRLFQPFRQADESTTRRFGGTGLGLAISKDIADMMGGQIGCSSAVGEGSTFWVELPFKIIEPFAAPQPQSEPARVVSLRDLRVLLAEDNEVNQIVATAYLESFGCKVTLADDGLKAIQLFEQQPFDVILMDCHMPGIDGFEATSRIRSLPAGALIPILALTAGALSEERQRCFDSGMNDFLAKPFTPEDLSELLSRWAPAPIQLSEV